MRNSVGNVVQFKYGDDGLDPACLEGDTSPVEYNRSWKHARAVAKKGGKSLLPWEVIRIVKNMLESPAFVVPCEPKYIETVDNFIREKVVAGMIKLRTKYDMYEADEYDSDHEDMDMSLGAGAEAVTAVDNLSRVTENQLREFLEICRVRYLRAKIEPGSTVGAVGAQSIGEPGTQMTLKT